jgi:hypothetical protein
MEHTPFPRLPAWLRESKVTAAFLSDIGQGHQDRLPNATTTSLIAGAPAIRRINGETGTTVL